MKILFLKYWSVYDKCYYLAYSSYNWSDTNSSSCVYNIKCLEQKRLIIKFINKAMIIVYQYQGLASWWLNFHKQILFQNRYQ